MQIPRGILYVDPKTAPWTETPLKTYKGIVFEDNHHKKEYNYYFRFAQYHCNVRRFYFRMYALSYDTSDPTILDSNYKNLFF
jgi:hypothetical protein